MITVYYIEKNGLKIIIWIEEYFKTTDEIFWQYSILSMVVLPEAKVTI